MLKSNSKTVSCCRTKCQVSIKNKSLLLNGIVNYRAQRSCWANLDGQSCRGCCYLKELAATHKSKQQCRDRGDNLGKRIVQTDYSRITIQQGQNKNQQTGADSELTLRGVNECGTCLSSE